VAWIYVGWPTWEFLNSQFGAALVAGGLASLAGAVAGAFGGAWAAQRSADKSNRKKALTDEIKACNAGIDAAGSILNDLLVFRADPYLPLKHFYDEQRGLLEFQLAARQWLPGPMGVPMNVGNLPLMRLPVARLETVMFERVSLTTRAQGLANRIVQGVGWLNDTIEARDKFIVEMQGWPDSHKTLRTYAFPIEGHGLDNRFKDYMEQIGQHTNDVIYFSAELCKVLEKHGKRLEEAFRKKYRGIYPRTNRMHFDKPEVAGLLPDAKEYEAWENKWFERVPITVDRRLGKFWHAVRKRMRWPWKLLWKVRGWRRRKKGSTGEVEPLRRPMNST
jgi:hypothetical protein